MPLQKVTTPPAAVPLAEAPSPPVAIPVEPPGEKPSDKAVRETGVDPETGQILDPVRFEKWKQEIAKSPNDNRAPTNASLMEVFRDARLATERWVDDESRRSLILEASWDQIVNNPDLLAVLKPFSEHGPVMEEKLLKHLAFMIENRRSYYAACPD